MKIVLEPEVAIALEAAVGLTRGLEFSGFGWVRVEGDVVRVYDYVILDVGSPGYTEFGPEKIVPLLDREDHANMKLWLHRHPVGNGVPGQHNWSSLDQATIEHQPLGSLPEMVKWSVSIVRTPLGWVGRIDRYLPELKTVHLDVEPKISPELFGHLYQLAQTRWDTVRAAQELQDCDAVWEDPRQINLWADEYDEDDDDVDPYFDPYINSQFIDSEDPYGYGPEA